MDRAILDVLTLMFVPVPRSTVHRAISSARLIRSVQGADVQERLEALAVAGAVIPVENDWTLPPEARHRRTLALVRRGEHDALMAAVRSARPAKIDARWPHGGWGDVLRELHVALHAERWDPLRAALPWARDPWPTLVEGVDLGWLDRLPADLAADAATQIVAHATARLAPCADWRARLDRIQPTALSDVQHEALVDRLILEGRLDDARRWAAARRSTTSAAQLAWLRLLDGDVQGAVEDGEAALTVYLKQAGRRARFFPGRAGLFFVVGLLAVGRPQRAAVLAQAGATAGVSPFGAGHALLAWAATSLGGPDIEAWSCPALGRDPDPAEVLIDALVRVWTGLPARGLADSVAAAEAAGLPWLAAQLRRCGAKGAVPPGLDLSGVVRRPDRASKALAALEGLAGGGAPTAVEPPPERDLRLVWVVGAGAYGIGIEPREQVRSKGGWSKGRPVALKRLFAEARTLEHLTAVDRKACEAIVEVVSQGRYRDVSYTLDLRAAIQRLAGQPNLLAEVGGQLVPAEVAEAAPRLTVVRREADLEVALSPRPRRDEELRVVEAGPATFHLVRFDDLHRRIAEILGERPLRVPLSDERRVAALLDAFAGRIEIEADLQGAASIGADARPTFELRPRGEGLAIDAWVRPLGAGGPRFRPGRGPTGVMAEVAGRRVRAVRDLAAEARELGAILDRCVSLDDGESWLRVDVDAALTALSELQAATASIVWPAGAPIELVERGPSDLELDLRVDGDDFAIDGQLGGTDLGTLLGYLAASPSRFLTTPGGLIALTADLRQRLDELRALSAPGPGLRFHRLRLPVVARVVAGSRIRKDEGWQAAVDRLSAQGEDPPLPPTRRAELRPYQVAGFRWLSRLARWGVGGCLADDMGLGKTLQALALLLHRAPDGASLVVAPTSVLSVWEDEIRRRAPTLRVRSFTGPGRAAALEGLAPYDVVLTSYAILPLEAAALAAHRFVVAILDEAQAIKNPDTARAQAAFGLSATQRLAITGTPIENRLADLWSVYQFLNPGLLGTAAAFEQQFARPVERERSRSARDRLRRLIAPLMLRRTKAEVLADLPPRTEVALPIELGAAEVAAYEAVRADILARLDPEQPEAKRRFALLAGITRLRRAASHARMVFPEADAVSTKLQVLTELLDDIVPSGHRALVFSQFVDHLQLARQVLQDAGYRCRTLDGSTSAAARRREVASFQAGDGDVFLISLKAGGVGLNLTAADYVVHLDPWWNPAAEDQASDRSHRLGQTRPVMVIRLVARDTVEDRIVALHHRKRGLAMGILEGTDAAAALSEQELLDLIRGTA